METGTGFQCEDNNNNFVFYATQVDTAVDFFDDEDSQEQQLQPEGGVDVETHPAPVKPSKPKRLTSKTTPAAGNSLELLDVCLPGAPPNRSASMPGPAAGDTGEAPRWLREALFSTASGGADATAETGAGPRRPPLVARLGPLAQRMRSLLLRDVYARGRTGSEGGWADGGRPAGFVGAGLAEELCLAVFGRIQGLRAQGVGKQVRVLRAIIADSPGSMVFVHSGQCSCFPTFNLRFSLNTLCHGGAA